MKRPALLLYVIWCVSTVVIWVLAMAPLPDSAPEWVVTTRAVCFGTRPDGLPEPHGWVSMLAPLPMLAALLLLMGGELRRDLRALGALATVVLVGAPLAGALWVGQRVVQAVQAPVPVTAADYVPLPPDYPRLDRPSPAFTLTDQEGRRVTPADLHGRVTLLTFVFAHCRTVCPVLVDTLRDTRAPAQRWFLTLDPWRDTPSSLPSLFRAWKLPPDARLLSGPPEEVTGVLDGFDVPRQRNGTDGEITHPALVLVIDATGRIVYVFNDPSASWLEEAVRRLSSP
ncbi:MAG: SCO family protein [Candidatus Eremiobacterota bacterium]